MRVAGNLMYDLLMLIYFDFPLFNMSKILKE